MKTRFNEKYEADLTPSRTLIEDYRKVFRGDYHDANLAVVHYRGMQVEFDLGLEYCNSPDADDRAVGADVLAQLGWSDRTFLDKSMDALLHLLDDSDAHVVYSAAVALGHRNDPRGIPALIPLAKHPDPDVRFGVVFGLTGLDDPAAVATLIELTNDDDLEVRNWALFGIGSQMELDTPAIREALFAGLSEIDFEARGEALVGLARRGDERAINAIFKEWEEDSISLLSIEAAEEMADGRLLPFLEDFEATHDFSENDSFRHHLLAAIATCRSGVRPN